MVYDTKADMLAPMTEENCNTEYWNADPDIYKPSSFVDKLEVFVNALARLTEMLFELLINSIKNA